MNAIVMPRRWIFGTLFLLSSAAISAAASAGRDGADRKMFPLTDLRVTGGRFLKCTVRRPGGRLAFEYRSEELGKAVELIPLYDIHCQRVAAYLPHVAGRGK